MSHFTKLISTICITILCSTAGIQAGEIHEAVAAGDLNKVRCIGLVGNASCKDDNALSEKQTTPQKYRYTITHSFRKVGQGDKVTLIYFAVPRSNDYQEISNYYNSKGELLKDTVTNEYYMMWDVSDDMSIESGEWFDFTFEFDYTPKSSEFKTQIVGEIYPYDTTSSIYQMYTKNYYGILVKDNPTLMKVSQDIWVNSTNIYDYAKKCLEYVNANFPYSMSNTILLSHTLEKGVGDCANLASLFISLLRTKNIPSRLVCFHQHSWAEFYLEKYGWIPVDPTFHLFGRASAGYRNQIAWSNNLVHHIVDPSGAPKTIWTLVHGLHYLEGLEPDHKSHGYECDVKMSKKKYKP